MKVTRKVEKFEIEKLRLTMLTVAFPGIEIEWDEWKKRYKKKPVIKRLF